MKKEDVSFIKQLISTLNDSEIRLRKFYNQGNQEGFERIKSFMLKIHNKIDELLK